MRILILILIASNSILAQEKQNHSGFHFQIGTQIRVTPIYVKRVPELISVSDRNIQEQPDEHLSGTLSFIYSLEKSFNSTFTAKFTHSIRYETLYWTIPFQNISPNRYPQERKKAFVSDFYFDLLKKFQLRSSSLKLGVGFILAGYGTNYILTQRLIDNNNQSVYVSSNENFQFPAISVIANWQKRNLVRWLRVGYCRNNPTIFRSSFLFPELGLQYNLFSF